MNTPGARASHGSDGRAATGRDLAWLLDLASAGCWTAIMSGLLVWQGGIWAHVNSGDLHAATVPWFEYVANAVLREGRLPLWQPYQWCGTPVLGLSHPSALYPPVLALFALLRPWAALQALYAFHILILTWGMTTYLRHHGIGRLAAGVAALSAITAVFRGLMLSGVDHPSFLAAVAWIPAMLLCWERAVRTGAARWVGCLGLVVAAQWLSGYPDFALDVPVLLGVMALVAGDGSVFRRVGSLLAGLLLGGALAAVQLLPLTEAVAESSRVGTGFPYEKYQALFAIGSTRYLAETLGDRFGPAAVVLALVGLWPFTRHRAAWLAAFIWSTFALNLPFRLLYLVPPYSGVRFPFGWGGASGVFLGVLAAAGLNTIWRRPGRWVHVLGWVLAACAVAYGLFVVWRAPVSLPPFRPQGRYWQAPDLALAEQRAVLLRGLLENHTRLLSEGEATAGSAIRYGISIPNGHEPALAPRRMWDLLARVKLYDPLGMYRRRDWSMLAKEPEIGALLGIGTVVVAPGKAGPLLAAGFESVGKVPPGELILKGQTLPRVRLVHETIEAVGEQGTLEAVIAHAGDAVRVAVVEAGALAAPLAPKGRNAVETARIVVYEPEHVVVDATVAAPALLVLTDTFYPGWRATVDDAPTLILRADHAFRGVRLDPGRHRVDFRYAPESVRRGAAITLVAIVAVLVCIAWPSRQLHGPETRRVHQRWIDSRNARG